MKVLVTGATGFIGSRLCMALTEKGYEIKALVLPGDNTDSIGGLSAEICTGDLTDPESLKGLCDNVDTVYHLAARVLDWGSKEDFYSVIYDGTRNILEEASGKATRFVFISSIAACGLGKHLKGRTEEDEAFKSGIPYNDAKLDAEQLVRSYRGGLGTWTTIVRPSNVTGPNSVWVTEIIDRFRTALSMPFIDGGKYSSSLVYVGNLVDGIIRAGTQEIAKGKTYFFRDDWHVTWEKYISDLGAMIGKKPIGNIPFGIAWAMGYVLEKILTPLKIRPPLTRLAAGIMGRDNDVNASLARKELGWETKVSYQQALGEIEKWVKTHMV
jgi:nucleoside-diphosphate-sugar epimerase